MSSEHLTWRDMYRENPEYFDTAAVHPGYPEPVPAPGTWRVTRGRHDDLAEMYRCTASFVLGNAREAGLRLVHGTVAFDGERRDDAWVELPNDLTYDGVTQAFYPTEEWRAEGAPEVSARYTPVEVARLVHASGHHGPWLDADHDR